MVAGVEVRIDRDSKLWVKGDGVMLGYWKDDESTLLRFDDQGWLDTQDLAKQNDDLSIHILGQSDDTLVLSNGIKVQPVMLEQEILNCDKIEDCIVVGTGFPFTVAILRIAKGTEQVDNEIWTSQVRGKLQQKGYPIYSLRVVVV